MTSSATPAPPKARLGVRWACALSLVPLLAACGGAGRDGPAGGSATVDSQGHAARDVAVAVAEGLAAAGTGARGVVACRPPAPGPEEHALPPAAAFEDRSVATDDPRHVVREGGVVEVLGTVQAVRQRVRELDQQTLTAQEYGFDEGGHSLRPERRITRGGVLLRLSGDLAESRVTAYGAALRELVPAAGLPRITHPTTPAEEAPCST